MSGMRVALNIRNANLGIPDGPGECMRGLIRGLAQSNSGFEIQLLADAAPRFSPPRDPNVRFRILRPYVAGNRGLRAMFGGDPWYRVRVAVEGSLRRWDAYLQSAHEPPPAFGVMTRVAIAYDLAFAHADAHANFEAATIAQLHRWTALNVHAADAIVTISETVARDVVRIYGVPWDRVVVAPLGVDRRRFHQIHDAGRIAECRDRYRLDASYVLFVGTVQPRKNIPTLVQGMVQAQDAGLSASLVVAGADGWQSAASLRAMANAGPRAVRYLGRVSAEDLPVLLAGARAFVSVARAEGFGMPALEAMAAGVPVVVANDGALGEVVGDAGLLVDPGSPHEIAEAILRISSDAVLRDSLIARGLERAAEFTWDAAGRSLWRAVEQACASC